MTEHPHFINVRKLVLLFAFSPFVLLTFFAVLGSTMSQLEGSSATRQTTQQATQQPCRTATLVAMESKVEQSCQ
ncbi:MAG: hypothetical protein MUF49_30420 [Oculatellaceae cyanobacterium Prado106]|jgi:sensor domain CHASE-containing protein|nr:hypothetical protein [Oculatellaceae cyanobacterium Prado106]